MPRELLTANELRATVSMEEYGDSGAYDTWLGLDIEGMHRILTQ